MILSLFFGWILVGSAEVAQISDVEHFKWSTPFFHRLSLEEIQSRKRPDSPLHAEDQAKVESLLNQWSSDSEKIWSALAESDRNKDLLHELLQSFYKRETEVVSIQHQWIDLGKSAPLRLETSTKTQNLDLVALDLLLSPLSSYEKQKLRSSTETDQRSIDQYFDSVGFAYFQDLNTKDYCSVSFVGQSTRDEHWIVLGGFDVYQAEDLDLSFSQTIQLGEFQVRISFVEGLDLKCSSALTSKPSSGQSEKRWAFFASESWFVGSALQNSLVASESVALLRQERWLRRGFESACGISESKVWSFYGEMGLDPQIWIGGEFFMDEQAPSLHAFTGASLDETSEEMSPKFSAFRYSNPDHKVSPKTQAIGEWLTQFNVPFILNAEFQ